MRFLKTGQAPSNTRCQSLLFMQMAYSMSRQSRQGLATTGTVGACTDLK